nr:helix-turn-helix domain-containing protein [Angustibacter aerolatus]
MLKDLIPSDEGPEITAATIIGQTASYFGLTIDDLQGVSRSRVLVNARQIAMYLCREAHRACRCRRSASSSVTATTPPSCTPSARSARRWPSAARSTTRSPRLTNRIKQQSR